MEDEEGECPGEGQGRSCVVNVRRTLLCFPVFQRTFNPVGLRQLKIFMSDILTYLLHGAESFLRS